MHFGPRRFLLATLSLCGLHLEVPQTPETGFDDELPGGSTRRGL
jgi:hypothetical protein